MKAIFASILILAGFGLLAGCNTTLKWAARRGDINAVKDLLNKGADAGERNIALMWAADSGRTEVVKLLIDEGADVNHLEDAALVNAAENGHTDTVKLLIEKGAKVGSDENGALINAALGVHVDTVKLLVEKSTDADIEAAIATLRWFDDKESTAGIKLIERFKPKRSQGISKDDLKTIVQAAVDGAKAQKTESKPPSVRSDIDAPDIASTARIMGDNDLAVIIGIEGYPDIPKSDYSYDDAKLVGDYARAMGFKPRNIELLLEERATKSALEKIIKTWLPNKAKPDSKVFIYYSGHGAPEPKTGDAYIVPFDGDPNYLSDTGYPLKNLYDSLGKLQVAEVTVVLDSCFSGSGGRSVLAKGARPLVMMTTSAVLPSNVAVLSATQGNQISTSSPEKGHGVFTYYFLKALKDGKKDVAEIYEYIKPLVEDEAKQLNVRQSPSVSPDAEKLKGKFGLRK